jgi:hypothetical protein
MHITIVSKSGGGSKTVNADTVALQSSSVVKIELSPKAVAAYQRVGQDLHIKLHSGKVIIIKNFYADMPEGNDLVLVDDDGTAWLGQHSDGLADFQFSGSSRWISLLAKAVIYHPYCLRF